MSIYSTSRWEAMLKGLYLWLSRNDKLRHLAYGYLSAIGIELIRETRRIGLMEIGDVLSNDFWTLSIYSIVFYLVIFILILFWGVKAILQWYFKDKSVSRRVKELFEANENPIFRGYELDGIGWGCGHTLMSAPRMEDGWKTEDLDFEFNNSLFCFRSFGGEEMEQAYQKYLETEFPRTFTSDGDKYMLTEKPVAYTDDNRLAIKLRRVKWSQLQFFWKYVCEQNRAGYIRSLFNDQRIGHPNSFCLHLVVVTNDDEILITCASTHKTNDYASSWSVSIGEQICRDDFDSVHGKSGLFWVQRALKEELSLDNDAFLPDNVRYLSVNVEGDIANCAFACMVELNIGREDLLSIITTKNRIDNEFQAVAFMSFDDIPGELIKPSRQYHPSAPLRMIDAYIHRRGIERLHGRLLDNKFGKIRA